MYIFPNILSLSALLDHPQRAQLDGHGNSTTNYIVFYWTLLNTLNLQWTDKIAPLWRKIHTCLHSRRCSEASFCRQKGTSQLHRLSWSGFAHQFSNMQGTHLCFAPWVTVKVLNTKICACGSNIDTRRHHGNSTNCYMSQERSNTEVLISLKLTSTQTTP